MQSKAATVKDYLASLPEDRRKALAAVRSVILKNLDKDFEEGMSYGMIGYYVPHRVYPAGYHCDPKMPLPYAGLASQKNHMSLYLMSVYGAPAEEKWLRDRWAKAGKKLDMGKCCIRFKTLEDIPLEVVGEAFRRVPASKHIEFYERNIRTAGKSVASKAAKSTTSKTRKSASPSRGKSATKSPRRSASR